MNNRAYEQGLPQKAYFKGDLSVSGRKENTVMRNHSENGVKQVVRQVAGREERNGDWSSNIRGSCNWKQSKASSWLTSLHIITNSFQLCGESPCIVSPDAPVKK